ncbi:phosphoribosylaminoimidazole carboxylase ATPase subunit [Fictibacillus macauensis ZFHKF-1]|uniref:N5-carboxyaminoimidazole ribonucleotide synthase n=1 Tax=Fictibacillus macauensis ZFHKF-1 TaxID=1196324 RepID=I8AHH6_9BACL|nr:5-(carboxyamino)imidazole ribonucleotide synthase [Fictibacillus macauensis]EIT84899.1 phosphoribosylaminoimidazole carboxylase ATPase subunit [Fictibacillus macauensis ZFHKF-1]
MTKMILPGQTIGILGGGQLGRMMAMSARELGYKVVVLDPDPNAPCGPVSDEQIVSAFDDSHGIHLLANASDVVTYEFENVDAKEADWLQNYAYLPQGSQLLTLTQHRLHEKKAIEKAGCRVAPYAPVNTAQELDDAISRISLPAVLKTCRGGYDGKGQLVLQSAVHVEEAKAWLGDGKECILEGFVSFEKELSVIVTRSTKGEMTAFPVAENIHVHHILDQSIVPARISKQKHEEAVRMAMNIAESLQLSGTLAVELFLGEVGDLYVNELAPRPHNSGHYSIEACETSQFQQHIRAICGLPLGNTELLRPAVMINVLGEHIKQVMANMDLFDDAKLHLYGKREAKAKRKMGHITVLGETQEIALQKAKRIRDVIRHGEMVEVTR